MGIARERVYGMGQMDQQVKITNKRWEHRENKIKALMSN